MSAIKIVTGGESHGPLEVCVIEGVPAGLALSTQDIDEDLLRRQRGYGRGGRMAIESDRCELVAGVRFGRTMGSPVVVLVQNKDHQNWVERMQAQAQAPTEAGKDLGENVPRPGHADLAGMAKYSHEEIRPVLERASARETVGRVAAGAVCKRMLAELGVTVQARVVQIGEVVSGGAAVDYTDPRTVDWEAVESSEVACDELASTRAMCAAIDKAKETGDTLGGVFEVWAWGLCPGLGSYVSADSRLDGRLLGSLGSIPGIKGVEIGRGFANAGRLGSQVHDELRVVERKSWRGIARPTNRAGGLEGGVTNGMPLVLRAAMKPIPTLVSALGSVNVGTMEETVAHVERSDVTAVPAAAVVGEAMVAHVVAAAYTDKFAADNMVELSRSLRAYEGDLEDRGLWRRS